MATPKPSPNSKTSDNGGWDKTSFIKPHFVGFFELARSLPAVIWYGLSLYKNWNGNSPFNSDLVKEEYIFPNHCELVLLALLEACFTLMLAVYLLIVIAWIRKPSHLLVWIMLKGVPYGIDFLRLLLCFFRPLAYTTEMHLVSASVNICCHFFSYLLIAELTTQIKTLLKVKSGFPTHYANSGGSCTEFVHVHPSYAQVVVNGTETPPKLPTSQSV